MDRSFHNYLINELESSNNNIYKKKKEKKKPTIGYELKRMDIILFTCFILSLHVYQDWHKVHWSEEELFPLSLP